MLIEPLIKNVFVVEHSLIVQWVCGSIPHGGQIEMFLVPAIAP